MSSFNRQALPEPITYYEAEGVPLRGKGTWRTGPCNFHGGSDSLRVNTQSGGFICMAACGARGGNVLDYHRAVRGLGFVEAAKALGAWVEDGKPHVNSTRPTPIPAKALLQLVAEELMIAVMVMADVVNGCLKDADFDRFREATGRVIYISEVANGLR